MNDDVLGRSAQLSYYFFLAHFPLLICTLSLLGIFAGPGQHLRHEIINFVYGVLPYTAAQLIDQAVRQVNSVHAATKMSFGLVVLLWSASAGMSAIMDTLNTAYEVKETRSFLRRTIIALGLTLSAAVLLLAAAGIVVGGGAVADLFTRGAIDQTLKFIRWPVAVGLVLFGLALIYFIAPNVEDREWRWITPGTVMALAVWVIASAALKVYLHFFSSFSNGYGSLGAVIVLLLWFYITGAAVLLGAELNHAIETVADTQTVSADTGEKVSQRGHDWEHRAA